MAAPRVTKKQKQAHDKVRRRNGLKLIRSEILADLKDQLPQFDIPQLFIIWYMEAKFGIDPDRGQQFVTDGSKDKGVDAIYIDSHNRCIHIIQSKYSREPRGAQNRQELIMAAGVARYFMDDDDEEFERWIDSARQEVKELGRDAYDRIWRRDYELHVHFVTCKTITDNLRADIKSEFRRIKGSKISIVGVDEVLSIAEQYFDGEVPAIDEMTVVPVAEQSVIHHKGGVDLHSYVCEVQCKKFAQDIGKSRYPLRLYFHRNIRGFLGDTQAVNADILNTLRNDPKLFFYLNNGITILTTGVKKGNKSLVLSQPQIINGQQTTHVLVKLGKKCRGWPRFWFELLSWNGLAITSTCVT